jgi:hypothetical protein
MEKAGKRLPPGEAAKEVTLVLTDVQVRCLSVLACLLVVVLLARFARRPRIHASAPATHAHAHAHAQGSTELWEWDSHLASEAFKIHDRVLRQYMTQVCVCVCVFGVRLLWVVLLPGMLCVCMCVGCAVVGRRRSQHSALSSC